MSSMYELWTDLSFFLRAPGTKRNKWAVEVGEEH